MGRYYFRARLGDQVIPDDVGVDLRDVADIRNLISTVLHQSRVNLSLEWVFDVADEDGRIVLVVPLAEIPRTQ